MSDGLYEFPTPTNDAEYVQHQTANADDLASKERLDSANNNARIAMRTVDLMFQLPDSMRFDPWLHYLHANAYGVGSGVELGLAARTYFAHDPTQTHDPDEVNRIVREANDHLNEAGRMLETARYSGEIALTRTQVAGESTRRSTRRLVGRILLHAAQVNFARTIMLNDVNAAMHGETQLREAGARLDEARDGVGLVESAALGLLMRHYRFHRSATEVVGDLFRDRRELKAALSQAVRIDSDHADEARNLYRKRMRQLLNQNRVAVGRSILAYIRIDATEPQTQEQ